MRIEANIKREKKLYKNKFININQKSTKTFYIILP